MNRLIFTFLALSQASILFASECPIKPGLYKPNANGINYARLKCVVDQQGNMIIKSSSGGCSGSDVTIFHPTSDPKVWDGISNLSLCDGTLEIKSKRRLSVDWAFPFKVKYKFVRD